MTNCDCFRCCCVVVVVVVAVVIGVRVVIVILSLSLLLLLLPSLLRSMSSAVVGGVGVGVGVTDVLLKPPVLVSRLLPLLVVSAAAKSMPPRATLDANMMSPLRRNHPRDAVIMDTGVPPMSVVSAAAIASRPPLRPDFRCT